MRHRALRVVRTAVAFLLLGAIINVAVAWGLTAWEGTPRLEQVAYQRTMTGTTLVRAWSIWRGEQLGRVRVKSSWHERPAPKGTWGGRAQLGNPASTMLRWSGVLRPAEVDRTGAPARHCRVMDSAGWPMLSMWCCVEGSQPGKFASLPISPTACMNRSMVGGVELPRATGPSSRQEPWRALPLYPLWPGFVVNSLAYAGALALVFMLLGKLRRMRRRRCGLCEQCGYDLRGRGSAHDRCPECGAIASLGAAKNVPACGS